MKKHKLKRMVIDLLVENTQLRAALNRRHLPYTLGAYVVMPPIAPLTLTISDSSSGSGKEAKKK